MITRTVILTIALLRGASLAGAGEVSATLPAGLHAQCINVLRGALEDESPWVRVHAGEALASLGHPEPVLAAFRPRADIDEPQHRIGVWRVLALAERGSRREEYLERIRDAFLDPNSPDQTHAIEALAKLNVPQEAREARKVKELAEGGGPAAPFAIWRLAQSGDATAVNRLTALLESEDDATRIRAAYVLGRLQPLPQAARAALAAAAAKEPAGPTGKPIMRAALGIETARKMAADPEAPQYGRYSAAMAMAELGSIDDVAALKRLLRDEDQDVRVAAAYAALRIAARATGGRADATTRSAGGAADVR